MKEPAHDYRHVPYGGKTVNWRTRTMLEGAATLFGAPFRLTQGSYNRGVSASAGTHDGGGVVDIDVSSMSTERRKFAVQCLRKVGFFAWLRVPPAFAYHIHAVAIGDRELSSSAKSQVRQGFADRDGLARSGPDPAPDPYPLWIDRYGTHVSLDRPDPEEDSEDPFVWAAGPWRGDVSTNSSRIVQRALNIEFPNLPPLRVDGRFGPLTRERYSMWQKKLGLRGDAADGVPGPWSLNRLGAKHGFEVRDDT
jgi:hypothetical protein